MREKSVRLLLVEIVGLQSYYPKLMGAIENSDESSLESTKDC